MNLDLNENELTIMGIKFDNIKDFKNGMLLVQISLKDGHQHPTMLSN